MRSGHCWSHSVITHTLTNLEDDVKPFEQTLHQTFLRMSMYSKYLSNKCLSNKHCQVFFFLTFFYFVPSNKSLGLSLSIWVDNRSSGLFEWTLNLVWLIEMINILYIKVMMNKNFRPNKSRPNSIDPPSNWQSKCLKVSPHLSNYFLEEFLLFSQALLINVG